MYSPTGHNMSFINTYAVMILIGVNLVANNVSCIKCYVCDASNCSDFNNLSKNLFVRQCPPKHVGCVYQKSGNIIAARSCETYKGTFCQKLNEEDYCFCDSNLCNGAIYTVENTDDEELVEGSGTEIARNDVVTETVNSDGNIGNVIKPTGILICCVIWLI